MAECQAPRPSDVRRSELSGPRALTVPSSVIHMSFDGFGLNPPMTDRFACTVAAASRLAQVATGASSGW